MKNEPIYLITHENPKNSYWDIAVISGIYDAARECQCIVSVIDDENIGNISGRPVLVSSGYENWVCEKSELIVLNGGKPVVVNAVEIPSLNHRYDMVSFEFETVIDKCMKHFQNSGRTNTVLLGVRKNSHGDKLKCDAYNNRGDIFWIDDSIEACVNDFLEVLKSKKYDSVICTNDTFAVLLEQKLLKTGYRVPDDIYIVGMGNSIIGQNLTVPLTSITLDYYMLGKSSVRLYQNIINCEMNCRMKIEFPCHLEVRASAPFNEKVSSNSVVPKKSFNLSKYFSGDTVQNIINVESLLQGCEEMDVKILTSLCYRKSTDVIADELYLSSRAVRYRISNIIKKYGFNDRSELEQTIRKAILNDLI